MVYHLEQYILSLDEQAENMMQVRYINRIILDFFILYIPLELYSN